MKCSDISLDEGWGGEDRGEWLGMLADTLRTGGNGPSLLSGEWAIPGKWSENWYLVCWLDCLCVSLSLVETTSHRAQAGLDPVILSPSLPEHGNGNCASLCPIFYGTLRINAGLGALVWKAVDKILANRIYLYLCVFRKYMIWKDSQKWE